MPKSPSIPPHSRHADELSADKHARFSGGNPNRENEPRREDEPPREDPQPISPTPTEPPDYRDEPPPKEKADGGLWPSAAAAYGVEVNTEILSDEEIDRGDLLRSVEGLGRNNQKTGRLSQDDVEEWQNKGAPAQGRSSRAFEEEIRYHDYHDEGHDHPHWYHDTRSRRR